MSYVVDASVAVKWVVPELLSEQADRLLDSDDRLIAPDLLLVEAANALWKKRCRREISAFEAARALSILGEGALIVFPAQPLLARALTFADRLDHPVYDCVYLALAERERATFVTADERLTTRLARRGLRLQVAGLRSL